MINSIRTYAEGRERPEEYTDVVYAATHLRDGDGSIASWNSERGMVSSSNERFIFIKFYSTLSSLGWHGATAQACSLEDVIPGSEG